MSTTKNNKEYVDPILIEEGFFIDEEDYVKSMDEVFEALREATEKGTIKKREQSVILEPTKSIQS